MRELYIKSFAVAAINTLLIFSFNSLGKELLQKVLSNAQRTIYIYVHMCLYNSNSSDFVGSFANSSPPPDRNVTTV